MSTDSEIALTGSCQCGRVTYSSASPPLQLTNCHCKTCRKLSGAPFLTFAQFPRASITWASGEESLKTNTYSDLAERTHCAECGSPISMQYKCQPDMIHLTADTINEESVKGPLPKVEYHIFVGQGEKAGWYDLPEDKIPRYARFTAGFQRKIDEWRKILNEPGLG